MYSAGKWDWSFRDDGTHNYGAHARGYARRGLVGSATGAVHTELGLCRLSSGGQVDRHVHSFERCAYILGGEPEVEVGAERFQLCTGDYVLFPVGSAHAWLNAGSQEAHWLELSTPQHVAPDSGRQDTYFLPPLEAAGAPRRPDFGDPTVNHFGHYLGTPPQQEALGLSGPVRGRAPAGMDTALLAYSGISIKMLVDSSLGAELLTMFTVDYEPGGAAQMHDHPFEETYFFLEGEIEAEIDGDVTTFRAGDFLYCGVGTLHGFFNTSPGRVRWIETQAPQPPRRHSYRWPAHWAKLSAQLTGEARA
jgi:quercetin dioxygenase-like cupin family protein